MTNRNDPNESPAPEPVSEGVRIIGAAEARRVLDAGRATGRRADPPAAAAGGGTGSMFPDDGDPTGGQPVPPPERAPRRARTEPTRLQWASPAGASSDAGPRRDPWVELAETRDRGEADTFAYAGATGRDDELAADHDPVSPDATTGSHVFPAWSPPSDVVGPDRRSVPPAPFDDAIEDAAPGVGAPETSFDPTGDHGLTEDGLTDDGLTDDGVADDGRFDDGRFDDGRFDDGRFDDGRFDDGRFDDGVADDGRFDDGVADDGVAGEPGFGDRAPSWATGPVDPAAPGGPPRLQGLRRSVRGQLGRLSAVRTRPSRSATAPATTATAGAASGSTGARVATATTAAMAAAGATASTARPTTAATATSTAAGTARHTAGATARPTAGATASTTTAGATGTTTAGTTTAGTTTTATTAGATSGTADSGATAAGTRFTTTPGGRRPRRPVRGRAGPAGRHLANDAPSPRPPAPDLWSRLVVGAALAVLLIVAYIVGPRALVVLAAAVVLLCATEAFGMLQRCGFRPATLLGLAASGGLMFAAYWRGQPAVPLVVGLAFVGTMVWYLLGIVEARPLANVAVTSMTILWVGLLGSFAALLLRVPNGRGLFLGAVVVTVASDIVAYFGGRRWGRHALAPDISPGKTVEGLLAGAVAAVVVGAVIGEWVTPWGGIAHGLLLGVAVAIFAPIGDLFESLIKRDLEVKDSGTALAAHGGLLDRFDSVLVVLPVTYYLADYLRLLK